MEERRETVVVLSRSIFTYIICEKQSRQVLSAY